MNAQLLGASASAATGSASPATFVPHSHAEKLVIHRIDDFRDLARRKGTLDGGESKQKSKTPVPAPGGKSPFMREFFQAISEIQTSLNAGRNSVKLMAAVLEDSLQATTQERQNQASDRLDELVESTSSELKKSKAGLDALKAKSDSEAGQQLGQAEAKIQLNMQQAMARKHRQLLQDFQQAQVDYKRSLERRQHREMLILMPDSTEEEREKMIQEGETTGLIVAKKMAGAHAMLLDEVQRIRDKHQDILRLERSINDLAAMFQDMAVLVEAQGEMLDAIEVHVHKAKECTSKAEQELIKTRKIQYKTQRQMCCLTVFMLIIALSIVGPLLLK
eukprot:TRINITY_DN35374_c0_g1_i1.p1 TRINITY_DN35374_c0_g1~~TRINITY_DN35374_c0_g1_i1.p1  ORF type:complete len:333 (+),score=109.31 TRINITY_DN35374_c0_g1_i1:84-1082(+)